LPGKTAIKKNMFYVYVLKNKNNKKYFGYSGNLQNRLKYHNLGKVRSTKNNKP